MGLVDAGAQSPQETWLRLQLVKVGLPTPQTQIPVRDEFGDVITYLDMGWPNVKVAVEYGDQQYLAERWQSAQNNRRLALLERLGWAVVRVVPGENPSDILRRVRAPLAQRTSRLPGGAHRGSR